MYKKKIYAAYGSNMNLEQMKKRCPQAEKIGTGVLKDYWLEFKGSGVATVSPMKGSEVPIVLWNITPGCEKCLDVYEGYPDLYIKEEIDVQMNHQSCKAMAYVMTQRYSVRKCSPRLEYYSTIRNGYLDNKIDLLSLEEALKRSQF